VACAAAFLALCALLRAFVTDDAWISVRYAETLASGHRFAW
jgi:arabinofuranosyltransferase